MAEATKDKAKEPQKAGGKGGKLKIIVIGVVLLAVLGGGGFFAWQKFIKPKFFGGGEQQAEAGAEGHGKDAAKAEGGHGKAAEPPAPTDVVVSMPAFVVNLADPLGRRYLKLALDVEVKDKDAAQELSAKAAKVRDAVILLLSSKTYQDLSTMESKILLKKEIAERLNQALGGSRVQRVYITDMVVQ